MITIITRITNVHNPLDSLVHEGGVILIDKEQRWTSFDVVAKLRRLIHVKKIGHAGTLDPMATGLLIVCVENATKHVSSFQSLDKEYRVEVKLGARTASDDAETPEEEINDIQHLHSTAILATINRFIGTFEQIPPNYSAIHVSGKRAYELARQGLNVPLSPRIVTVHAIDDVNIALPFVRMTVRCSKGTYIRALARDIGNALGVGAYVTDLRRTAIGNYRVEDAFTLRELAYYLHSKSHADLPVSR